MAQKTPVSLMNELAKTNKLTPEYKLIEETGPAHQRNFRVQLTLGEVGSWEGAGTSIKQARHAAARVGLEKCGLCVREKKPKQQPINLTPTVELNGLAMKLGRRTEYQDLPPMVPYPRASFPLHMGYPGSHMPNMHRPPSFPIHQPPHSYHGGYHPRPSYCSRQGRWPRTFHSSLTVGDQVFRGEGSDKQSARHNAALKAIDVLHKELALGELQLDGVQIPTQQNDPPLIQNGDVGQTSPPSSSPIQAESSAKSEISLVYEIATKRKMTVKFEDVSDTGPAHMKKFVVRAMVGEFMKDGEGPKKKDAKNAAAKKILEDLLALPELADTGNNKKASKFSRRGPRTFKQKPKADIDPTLNPISILGQLYQKAKESSPVYTTIQDRGIIQGKEFVIQVTAGKHQAKGSGRNKKEAKKNAAEAMLQTIGFRPTPTEDSTENPNKEAVPKQPSEARPVPTILGRQLKPGLLPMGPEMAKLIGCDQEAMMNTVVAPISLVKQEPQLETVDVEGSLNRAPGAPVVKIAANAAGKSLTAYQKFIQLAEKYGLRVQFTDYPKENNQPQMTHVSVSTVPPLSVYGSSVTVEGSREDAAANALKELNEMLAKDQLQKDFQAASASQPGVKDEMRELLTEVKNE